MTNRIILRWLEPLRLASLILTASPAIHGGTHSELLESRFASPPAEYRLVQYGLDQQTLEKYPRYGIGGFTAFFYKDLYQSEPNGIGQIGPLVEAAHRDGMRVWLADDFGYPSGMAGGRVVEENPDYEVRGLTMVAAEGAEAEPTAVDLPAGAERFVFAVLYPLVNQHPNLDHGRVVPVSPQRVETVGLDGSWRLCAFAAVIRDRDVQAQQTQAQFKHTGHYPDLLNPDAVARFIANMHAPIAAQISDLPSKVEGFYANEPNLMQLHWKDTEAPFACMPWSDQLPVKFREMHGYDLVPRLAALFDGEDTASRRVRMHFQQAVADLLATNFARQIGDWCRVRGIHSSGHFLLEQYLPMHVACYGDYLKFASEFDVPAIDTGIPNPDRIASFNYQFARFTSAVAVWKKRDRTLCLLDPIIEGGGLKRLSPAMPLLLNSVNMASLYGISEFSSYLPLDPRADGSATGYTVDEYRALNDYVGRLGVVLRGAQPATTVALYYPIAMFQADYRPSNLHWPKVLPPYKKRQTGWDEIEEALRKAEIECTIVHPEAVAQASIEDGTMTIGYGVYRYLVMPQMEFLPPAVLEKLEAFQSAGGTVLWVGSKPGYGAYDREDDAVRAALERAEVIQSSELAARITNPYPANFGLQFEPGPDHLAIARFDRGNQPVYLLVNRTEQSIAARVSAPDTTKMKVLDPTTGSVTEIALPSTLELDPFRSLLILPD